MQGTSLVAQLVKNPPAMWETSVQSLGRENPLEKGMPTHFCILAWRIPWTEEPGYSSGVTESDTTEQLTLLLQLQRVCKPHSCISVKWVQAVGGMIVLSAPRSDPSSTVEEKSVCALFPVRRTDMVKQTHHTQLHVLSDSSIQQEK